MILPWGEPKNDTDTTHQIYESCFPSYYDALMAFLEEHRTLLSGGKFNTASFSWDRLLWVYLHMFTEYAIDRFRVEECKIVPYQDMPERPCGGKWIALGFNGGWDLDCTEQGRKEYMNWDGPVHKTGKNFAQGYFHHWSSPDSSVFFEISNEVFALCEDIIKGTISVQNLTEEQKYLFSIAIEKKLFLWDGDGFRQNYYFVSREELQQLHSLAMEFYPTAMVFFLKAYKMILAEHEASIPKHLRWQMGNFLSNQLGIFVTASLYEGVQKHALSVPDENNREWLSLFASE